MEPHTVLKQAADILAKVRRETPLVQAITNYVTIGDCANILLAFGASPAMCESMDEAYDFARIASSVYVNLGTLTKEQELAICQAGLGAKEAGRPVVVDPAGCGAIPRKTAVLRHLAGTGRVDLIKGNTGEIKALAGMDAKVKGVDSTDDQEGVEEAAVSVAKAYGCAVAATGRVDVITDGDRVIRIDNGTPLLTRITGAGCMLGALCAATAAVCEDSVMAAAAATLSLCIAGELAYEQAKAPGSFRMALIDQIYLLEDAAIMERGKLL